MSAPTKPARKDVEPEDEPVADPATEPDPDLLPPSRGPGKVGEDEEDDYEGSDDDDFDLPDQGS